MSHHGDAAGCSWPPWRPGVLGTGCGVVTKVRQDVHNVEGNKATVDSFTQNLQSGQSTAFEATYTTTGSAPATVVYAVDPSSGGLAFHETQTGANASNLQLIVNSSGESSATRAVRRGVELPEARQVRRCVGERDLRLLHPGALGRLPQGGVVGGRAGRGQGDVLDHVAERLRHELRGPGCPRRTRGPAPSAAPRRAYSATCRLPRTPPASRSPTTRRRPQPPCSSSRRGQRSPRPPRERARPPPELLGPVPPMTTFIVRYDTSGPGVRLAVKDLIDMEGEPTTAGCRAVAGAARAGAEGRRVPGRAPVRRGRASWGAPTCTSWRWA